VGNARLSLNQLIGQSTSEAINGIDQIKIFSLESVAKNQILNHLKKLITVVIKFNVTVNIPRYFSELLVFVFFSAYLIISKYYLNHDLIHTVPKLGVFALSFYRIMSSLSLIMTNKMALITYLASAKAIEDQIANSG